MRIFGGKIMVNKKLRYFVVSIFAVALITGLVMLSASSDEAVDDTLSLQMQIDALEAFMASTQVSARSGSNSDFTGSIWGTPLSSSGFAEYDDMFMVGVTSAELTVCNELKETLSAATGIPVERIVFAFFDYNSVSFPTEAVTRTLEERIQANPQGLQGIYDELNRTAGILREMGFLEALENVERELEFLRGLHPELLQQEDDKQSQDINLDNRSIRSIRIGSPITVVRHGASGIEIELPLTAGHPVNSSGRSFFTACHGLTQNNDLVRLGGEYIGVITWNRFEPGNGIDVAHVALFPEVHILPFMMPTFENLTNFRGGQLAHGVDANSFGRESGIMMGTAVLYPNHIPPNSSGLNLNNMILMNFGGRGLPGDSGSVLWRAGTAHGTFSARVIVVVFGQARDLVAFSRANLYN